MPFCDDCDRFYNPNTLSEQGECPTCHRVVAEATRRGVAVDEASPAAPWHFKLLVAAVCAYLGWRFVELLMWLF